ncbi:hypothetical protein PN36_34270 [Candidatus Thiomargarita nelsonii]|uniref:Exopolysaccharide biosynthesis protein n=1 Tax=Candidatus Thiomargarita nelsonii TaxID=1003181 RepID=A0A4E0RCJ5_9GAMM|nr:hypothetical protein PN36_34270 [Candidatus Thiomargarita nelsonii]
MALAIKPNNLQSLFWKRVLLWHWGKSGEPWRWLRYAVLGILINGLIWSTALSYLYLTQPTYTSKWTLILPGTGAGANITIDNIGQASTVASSPYGHSTLSPKVNYKSIVENATVLQTAADSMKMTKSTFGKPKIKLIAQTSLILFELNGKSPQQAVDKSWALYHALQTNLQLLRLDEIKQRENSFSTMLRRYENKLKTARDALLAHKIKTKLVSVEQHLLLATSIEQLRQQRAEGLAEHEKKRAQVRQLSKNLGITAQQAADALLLKSDLLFQENLKNYTDASALLTLYLSKWGNNHPQVVKERAHQKASHQAMLKRSSVLLGRSNVQHLNLNNSEKRAQLFQNLISLYAEQHGLAAKAKELARLINKIENRLNAQNENAAKLEELQREHRIAEAVYTSARARIETSQADLFASYPLLQMLSKPSLPDKPSSPKRMMGLLGAILASLFTISGLLLIWIRAPYIRKLLNESDG